MRAAIDTDATVAVLDRLVAVRGTTPDYIRCDNGPELTANALHDWCRFSSTGAAYIEPGSPWQNAYVESFGSRVRDELLGVELFERRPRPTSSSKTGASTTTTTGRTSALGMMAPVRFAASRRRSGSTNQRLSSTVDR